jgi:hypothetical protein
MERPSLDGEKRLPEWWRSFTGRGARSWTSLSTNERFMAKRMGAKTIEVKASHVSLISQPQTIANLILEAAGQA